MKLNVATPECINSDATLSLYILRNPSEQLPSGTLFAGSENIEEWLEGVTSELLCGPVNVKSHLDITEQRAVLTLAHPRLLQCGTRPVILLCFQDLFVSHYAEVTEEASKSLVEKNAESESPGVVRRRIHSSLHVHRPRLLKKTPPPARPALCVHSSLQVTVFPYRGSKDIIQREKLLECIFHEDLITRLCVTACGYRIEEGEFLNLPEPTQALVRQYLDQKKNEQDSVEELERRQCAALDVLCWSTCLAYCNGDR